MKRLQENKNRRKLRVRSKLHRNLKRPGLVVNRSNKHIYAQIVDITKNATLVAVNDLKTKTGKTDKLTKTERAVLVGEELAKKALVKKIKEVVFNRGSSKFHGRVKALADGARKGGLLF